MAVELELDGEMFAGLGGFTTGADSVLSPWHGVRAAVTEAVLHRLARAGAIEHGQARAQLRPTLAAMAAATATTTLRFLGTGALLEYVTWVSADHGPVGLSGIANNGNVRLEDPAPTDRIIDAVAGLVGRSQLRGLDLTLDLSIDDGLVLAAIIDIQRRAILRGVATGQPAADEPADLPILQAALNQPPPYGFSLVDEIERTCGVQASQAAAGLSESLARLAKQGLIGADSSAARLVGVCAEVPQYFPAIASLLDLANAWDTGTDDVARVGVTCLQAGVSDLMTIEWIQSGIHIETVSADTVVCYIERFLRQPDLARESAPPQATPAAGTPQQAPSRPVVMTQGRVIEKPPWRPTHLAPAIGLSAWATPDPSAIPIAYIDPGVELQLLERSRDWAHIACSNGWSAWVDARAIEPRPADHATAARPPVAQPYPAAGRARHTAALRPEREPAPTPGPSTPAWRPTHLVPDSGLSAWAAPDRNRPPVARIDPRVELRLLGRSGDWAHIVCVNGWSAWVDGHAIQPLPDPAGYETPTIKHRRSISPSRPRRQGRPPGPRPVP